MLVGIHQARYDKYDSFADRFHKILHFNGIDSIRLASDDEDFLNQVKKLDLFIYRWIQFDDYHQIAKTIIPVIEMQMGIPCLPGLATCWHYDDKIKQYFLLKYHNFPLVDTRIFWNKKKAMDWAKQTKYPIVFKLKSGAGSKNVVLVQHFKDAQKLIRKMFSSGIYPNKIPLTGSTKWKDFNFYNTLHGWGGDVLRWFRSEDINPFWQKHKNYVLFQKFLPNNSFDTRITVIGKYAYGLIRKTRENDFRASGSGKIERNHSLIDQNCIKIAFQISKTLNFQSMAYDFIYDEDNRPRICEISYTYNDLALFLCPGIWDAELNWHEGNYWPQYLYLKEGMQLPELKQPQDL